MTTYREAIYMVLDLLKERSDDAYYTEEHVAFILNKARATFLEKQYKESRNTAHKELSSENSQVFEFELIPADTERLLGESQCLKTKEKVPEFIEGFTPHVFTVNRLLHSNVQYVNENRMPYVGHNRWLSNIIYCAKAEDGHFYLKSVNPSFAMLQKIKVEGVLVDPLYGVEDDYMDKEFPLEASLVSGVIEYAFQILSGAKYQYEDKINNARDEYGGMGSPAPAQKESEKDEASAK